MVIGFFVCKPHTLRHSHRIGAQAPHSSQKRLTKQHKKKTTHISVRRLGGGSKGSRSAAGGDTAVRRALARAIKSTYPRNPAPTFYIAWRTPMDGIATARSGGRRRGGWEGYAMLASEQTATANARGESPTLLAKTPTQNSTKKRRLTLL